ncbi:solute carrier family 15 member 2-like [Aethina tumida]|uniref:solute carrier family 15 member 2-like n=1 Tax=Aethina tumida TaxID=116153 RepID=UPI00096AE164|nr:solute carrier family 15 member 2-like [Aethina tumida]
MAFALNESSYPTAVFCIIATEFCERFSFCGLRTILSLYLRNNLLFSENASTVIYHVFNMGCYIVPLAGAVCADSYIGRYRTIRNFSLIYLIGNMLMCVAAVPSLDISPVGISATGLVLIAIGTGGIKPCVAAFGGEQFHLPDQQDLLTHFFSIFYFTINLGGFVGMILTPIMRKWISCFGDDTCYALGFGFPAALMLLSILLFVMGKRYYKVKTPKTNVIVQFVKCTAYALGRKRKSKTKLPHWLDYADGVYNSKLIADMKLVCSMLLLYAPLPIFWSLFDQQGSRWTFQASHMDGNVFGTQIVPDQMQVINPGLVLILIPIFDNIFYPCFAKCNLMENSLHRMAIGGIIAGLAFFSAGVLELILETTYAQIPDRHTAGINVINTLPCDIKLENPLHGRMLLRSSDLHRINGIEAYNYTTYALDVEAPLRCGDISFNQHKFNLKVLSFEQQVDTVMIGLNSMNEIVAYVTDPVDFQKSLSGAPRVRIAYIRGVDRLHNVTVTLQSTSGMQDVYFVQDDLHLATSAYMELPQGIYECKISSQEDQHLVEKHFHLALGGVYSLVVRENDAGIEFLKLFIMSEPNSINILWLIPQYFLISVAEIMFGIAGLEFSFTQAPKCMKTVAIAGWYLSVAVGNFLVIIITQLNLFKSQANEFFLFAVLIVADMVLFMEMASNYKFVQVEFDSSTILDEKTKLIADEHDFDHFNR